MQLMEAIKARRSIRGYKPDPVPKETIARILSVALRAPSAVNAQPWEITVVCGDALEALKRINIEVLESGGTPNQETKFGPFTEEGRQRRKQLAVHLFGLLGIAMEDKARVSEWGKEGCRFFDAPAAIIISVDRSLGEAGALFDVGALAQTIALAALEYDLGTCIQTQTLMAPEAVRRITGIPKTKRLVICLAMGYPDWDFPANTINSQREPLDRVVSWCGFE